MIAAVFALIVFLSDNEDRFNYEARCSAFSCTAIEFAVRDMTSYCHRGNRPERHMERLKR